MTILEVHDELHLPAHEALRVGRLPTSARMTAWQALRSSLSAIMRVSPHPDRQFLGIVITSVGTVIAAFAGG